MLGATAQRTLATKHTKVPTSSGVRRPIPSDSGPTNSWPSAMPIRNAVIDSWTPVAVVPSSSAIVGNAGRYMSIESGATAVSSTRTATNSRPGGTITRSAVSGEEVTAHAF